MFERNSAEAATRRVRGVRGLVQKLEVRLPADIVHDDERALAERAAWSAPGVTAVEDRLNVGA